MRTNALIVAACVLALVGCGDGLVEPADAIVYEVEGRISTTGWKLEAGKLEEFSEPLTGVEVSVYGLDRDRFSYVIESVVTDSNGAYLLRWRGSATQCPEAYPGLRPPGYHVTATRSGFHGASFTVVCGESTSTWMASLRRRSSFPAGDGGCDLCF